MKGEQYARLISVYVYILRLDNAIVILAYIYTEYIVEEASEQQVASNTEQ